MARSDTRIDNIAAAACAAFGVADAVVTTPGGYKRESVRVDIGDRSVIATRRADKVRATLERRIVMALSHAGAPVPRYLARHDDVFFQEDLGPGRLTLDMWSSDRERQQRLAGQAIQALFDIHEIADGLGLERFLPVLGQSDIWIRAFVNMPAQLSEGLGIAPPRLNADDIAARLALENAKFIKWDSRPANASVSAGETVKWFDWEHCGARHGCEDFAWLMADESWPLAPAETLELIASAASGNSRATADPAYAERIQLYSTFHTAQRINLILKRMRRRGWSHSKSTLHFDSVGSSPEFAVLICDHGRALADMDRTTRALVPWFDAMRGYFVDCIRYWQVA